MNVSAVHVSIYLIFNNAQPYLRDEVVHALHKGISQKVSVITRLEFELASCDIVVHYVAALMAANGKCAKTRLSVGTFFLFETRNIYGKNVEEIYEGHSINKLNFAQVFNRKPCLQGILFKEINGDGSFHGPDVSLRELRY